jgi:hypothetical protein
MNVFVFNARLGYARGHQRHSLGVRAESLTGQVGIEHHDSFAGQECPMRHRLV